MCQRGWGEKGGGVAPWDPEDPQQVVKSPTMQERSMCDAIPLLLYHSAQAALQVVSQDVCLNDVHLQQWCQFRRKLAIRPGQQDLELVCTLACGNSADSCLIKRRSFSIAVTEAPLLSKHRVRLPVPGPTSSTAC